MLAAMAITTLGIREVHTRQATVLGRLATATRAAMPGVVRWLTRTGRRTRRLVLHVGGLGSIVGAAWMVAVPFGLLTAGLSLLVLEYLSAPEGEQRR